MLSSCLEFPQPSKPSLAVQTVIDGLLIQGMPAKHFAHTDTLATLQKLCDAGATENIFTKAFEISVKSATKGFGVNYLAKVVIDLMQKSENKKNLDNHLQSNQECPSDCKPDYSGSKNWMHDLI